MKLLTALFIFSSSAVAAQTSDSASNSQSNSGVVFGDSYAVQQAPSAVSPGIMHTAPCIVGSSAGIGIPGIGLSGGSGRLENECNTREEIKTLTILLNQPPSVAKTAAILHYCNNDDSIRKTLVQMGICAKKTRIVNYSVKTRPQNVKYVNPYTFQICKDAGHGRIAYYPDTKLARKECRDFIKRNPGANIDTINR